jgi:hypothetical protein
MENLSVGKAAIDTTSGHAVDSFFLTDSQADPWAEQCLVNFIDILINHDTVKFPVPSRAHANAVEDDLLPLSVAEGRRIELLSPKSGAAAEEVILPFETLESEYNNFSTWAAQNAYFLSEWIRYHNTAPRILRQCK